ncbi:MAG: hypothetical protein OXC71_00960 [Chloroflexi bacterium]|nr:hypothetical protein [Chloroflexota bacterium]
MRYVISLEAQPLYFEGAYGDPQYAQFTPDWRQADTFITSDAASAQIREIEHLNHDLVIVRMMGD